jgi:AraC-like DNA-binding protein
MLAIPVPLVVSMMLTLLAVTLHLRYGKQVKMLCLFLILCASTTAMVGLRWTFDIIAFNYIQPILASIIPVFAWCTFTRASTGITTLSLKHAIGPLMVVASLMTEKIGVLPLDGILTGTYLFYGLALLRYSSKDSLLINVSLSNWEGVKKAENIAGWMLLFSALIDTLLSLDFAFNQGVFSIYILTIGHLFLLPVLSLAVLIVAVNTPVGEMNSTAKELDKVTEFTPLVTEQRAREIVELLDERVREKSIYLDPDLTLSKLSRKLGVPAKQISIAVNLIYQKNISKLINEYRIEHAKQELLGSEKSVTQIFMACGFQSKSNFNREFSRITGITPSEFKKQNSA